MPWPSWTAGSTQTVSVAACPVRLQCVPRASEAHEVPGDLVDPLGEVEHEVAPHLVRRYPDRVLLLGKRKIHARKLGRGGVENERCDHLNLRRRRTEFDGIVKFLGDLT